MDKVRFSSKDTLNLLRKDIRDNVENFVEEDDRDVLLMQYQPGIGKTTGVVSTIMDNNYTMAFFGPDHASVEKNVIAPYDLDHLKGKNQLCQNPRKAELVSLGLLENAYTCAKCEFEGVCEYKKMQYEFYPEPKSFGAVHAHIPYLTSFVEENYYQLIVIDENFLGSMFHGGEFTNRRIYKNLELLYEMDRSDERDYIIRFFKDLNTLLLTGDFELENMQGYDLKTFGEEYHRFLLDRLYDRKKVYYNDVQTVVDFLSSGREIVVDRRIVDTGFRKIFYADLYRYDFTPLDVTQQIIILDATTPKEIYEGIFKPFGKEIVVHKPKIKARSRLYQLTTHSYPMKYLNNKHIRKRLFNICKGITKKYKDEKVFFCIRKKFKKELEEYLSGSNNALVAHYGGVRGLNDYLDANVAVLIGAPFPNPDIVKLKSRAMKVKQEYITQMECNEEMLQTIHRIRPLLKDASDVFILSNVDSGYEAEEIKEIPITQLEDLLEVRG